MRTLKRCRAVCLALFSLLPLLATAGANPYVAIATRNVFQLRPAVVTEPVVETPPPVKITLLGIVTGFGPKQVMFRTTTSTPPKQASYILGEGERADELTVLQIDEKAATVRIHNQGVEQLLSLEKNGLKPGEASSGAPPAVTPRPAPPAPGVRSRPPMVEPPAPVPPQEEQVIRMEKQRC